MKPSQLIIHTTLLIIVLVRQHLVVLFLRLGMKTYSGKSLDDILYKGPKLQNSIITLLLNFRLHSVAVTADLKQMY